MRYETACAVAQDQSREYPDELYLVDAQVVIRITRSGEWSPEIDQDGYTVSRRSTAAAVTQYWGGLRYPRVPAVGNAKYPRPAGPVLPGVQGNSR